jgi:hypothetical protein
MGPMTAGPCDEKLLKDMVESVKSVLDIQVGGMRGRTRRMKPGDFVVYKRL